MGVERADWEPRYELRVPKTGLGGMDPRMTLLLWGGVSVVLGLVLSVLLIRTEFRMVVLLLLAFLGMACLSTRRGVLILTIFLPFMYFLRRLVLAFEQFEARDPILLFPAVTSALMFMGTIIFFRPRVFHYLRNSAMLKAYALLLGVFALQIVNPLQGSPLVGLGGALYFIVPMVWAVFGLLMTREELARLLRVVIGIGVVTSVYGLYQHYWGLFDFEIYELRSKDFLKYFGAEGNIRIMSTFSSLGDFSLYLAVCAFLAFARFWQRRRNLLMLAIVPLCLFTMVWTAVRTSYLLFLFSAVILLILGREARAVLVRGAMACAVIVAAYMVLYSYDARTLYSQQFSTNPYVVHTLSGVTHPTQEVTFKGRLKGWSGVVLNTVTQYPFGQGLGSTTTAAGKFGGRRAEVDSYFFELFYGSGLAAPVILIFLLYLLLSGLLRVVLEAPDIYEYKVCMALLCGLWLGSVFGLAARDTIMGPLMWLVFGWVAREEVERRMPFGGSGPWPAPA